MKWAFGSPTCETAPELRDIRNSTEKRKDFEKVVATVYIEFHPPEVLSSVYPKASESQLSRMALREAGRASPGVTGTLHGPKPTFQWGIMLRKTSITSPCMAVLICLLSGPTPAAPWFLPFPLLAYLLHSCVFLMPDQDAFPLLSSNRPQLAVQPGWIVKL